MPFKDNSFDVFFHLGAFNLFQHKKQALEDMIRVAKPGTRIIITDETEKATRLFKIFIGEKTTVNPPVDLIPGTMKEVKLDIIWKGYGYLVTFRKPG